MKKPLWLTLRVLLGIVFWGVMLILILWFFQVGFFGDLDYGPFWVRAN